MKIYTDLNKHYIPAKAILLPTDRKTLIHVKSGNLSTGILYLEDFTGNKHNSFHLYLVCDLPIEEAEYCLVDGGLGRMGIDKYQTNVRYSVEPKKVIAATDNLEIITINVDGLGNDLHQPLPQFPQSFIKEFVERQGKDVDVLVEVDLLFKGEDGIWYNKKNRNNSTYHYANEKLIDIVLNSDNTINLIFK